MRKLVLIVACVVSVLAAAQARASLITLQVIQPTLTTWQIWASDSGTNDGVYALTMDVVGTTTTGLGHFGVNVPSCQLNGDSGLNVGFASASSVVNGTDINFSVYQPASVNDPTEYVYGMGQVSSSLTSLFGSSGLDYQPADISNDAWGATKGGIANTFEVANGKNASGVAITLANVQASVFNNETGSSSGGGTTSTNIPFTVVLATPEPASLALLGLGGLLLISRRRRA
jgi:hypothetical protein